MAEPIREINTDTESDWVYNNVNCRKRIYSNQDEVIINKKRYIGEDIVMPLMLKIMEKDKIIKRYMCIESNLRNAIKEYLDQIARYKVAFKNKSVSSGDQCIMIKKLLYIYYSEYLNEILLLSVMNSSDVQHQLDQFDKNSRCLFSIAFNDLDLIISLFKKSICKMYPKEVMRIDKHTPSIIQIGTRHIKIKKGVLLNFTRIKLKFESMLHKKYSHVIIKEV
jgi:hypothetical protein